MQDWLAAGLSKVIADPARVLTAPAVLDRLSHDFYWYSPVLRPLLADKNWRRRRAAGERGRGAGRAALCRASAKFQ